jgi:hypothetical protein
MRVPAFLLAVLASLALPAAAPAREEWTDWTLVDPGAASGNPSSS